jgi:anthranilate synthase
MFVRVEGSRVETCPISGTIKRGRDPIEDAEQIKLLLNSFKDETELTMCTDVDRNDKSRLCKPGSVKVIGRRQIEMYSHLIHTVDHIEGVLCDEFDALDAFLTHMWAVTVTGAPKRAALKWIEANEDSPRAWYGGAVGYFSFSGNMNTGLTLRTIHIKDGIAEIRVGATILYDSIPEEEEAETLTKAAAMLEVVKEKSNGTKLSVAKPFCPGTGKRILLIDHEDSFVHTLANYLRQTGAEVTVLRAAGAREKLQDSRYDLMVLSPGPGRPQEFELNATIGLALRQAIPIFGVCLGLQGLVEYFGGRLGQLDYPQHGKPTRLKLTYPSALWEGLPNTFEVGRYHSLYVDSAPKCLRVTARSHDGVIMAIEHEELPIWAVQFHPESILSIRDQVGLKIINNLITRI